MAKAEVISKLLIQVGVSVNGAAQAVKAINKLRKAAGALEDQLEDAAEDAEDAADELNELGNKAKASADDLKEAKKQAKGAGDETEKAGKKAGKASGHFADIAAKVALYSGAIYGAVKSIKAFTLDQLESIDATSKMAESVGVGVEEFQRLEFAAGQSGVSSERLGMALKGLNARLLAVKQTGTGEAKMALDDLGLSLSEIDGKSATEKFAIISEALKNVEDDAERSALSARLFGEEAGPALANLLAQGGDGIRDLAAQAQVLTKEQADSATEAIDRYGELKNEIGAVARVIAVDLVPVIKPMIIGLREFIRANKDLIREQIGAAFKRLGAAIMFVAENWKLLAAGFAAAKLAAVISSIVAMTTAVQGLGLSFAVLAGPAGAIAATTIAIVAMTTAISKSNKEFDELTRKSGEALFATSKAGIEANARRVARGMTPEELESAASASGEGAGIAGQALIIAAIDEQARRAAGGGESDASFVQKMIVQQRKDARASGITAADIAAAGRSTSGGTRRGTGKTKAAPKSNVTFADVLRNVLRGRGENVAENVRGLAARTPATKAITPTVAVDFTYITVNQEISNPDPMAAGSAAAEGVRRVWQKAITTTGQQMPALPSR